MNVFGSVVDRYDTARPGYPPELADAIAGYHGSTPSRVVEIGAGTGKGTEVLVNGRKVGARLVKTRLGLKLSPGPEGVIPRGCYYVGSDHPRGFDSRYAEVGFACRGHILGSGRAIL